LALDVAALHFPDPNGLGAISRPALFMRRVIDGVEEELSSIPKCAAGISNSSNGRAVLGVDTCIAIV